MDDSAKPAGSSAHPLQGPHRADLAQPGPPRLRLVMQPAGPAVDLCRDSLLGRHSDADIRLALPDVSRRHCRFVWADGHWEVVDLDSLNGVFLNGQQVRRAALRHRDRIQVGSITLEVDLPTEPPLPVVMAGKSSAKMLDSIVNALPPAEDGSERRAS